MTLEGIFGIAVERLLDADHPVHDLRRVPAVLGRRQVLHRLLVRGDGRQADQRRAHRDARLVPARRPFGLGRGDDGDARRGRLRRCSPRSATSKDAAGGLLAAGGLGAIISPPVLGAAAFLIAEFLKISYLDVLLMATIPTCLYLPRALPHGRDRRAQVRHEATCCSSSVDIGLEPDASSYWFHFLSLVAIVAFMLLGLLARAVGVLGDRGRARHQLPATATARSFSYDLFRGNELGQERLAELRASSRRWRAARSAVLNVAATCAGAGHHRRRRDAHRPGAQVQLDRARLRRQLAAADGDLHLAHRLDRRPRGAGDRVATSSAR